MDVISQVVSLDKILFNFQHDFSILLLLHGRVEHSSIMDVFDVEIEIDPSVRTCLTAITIPNLDLETEPEDPQAYSYSDHLQRYLADEAGKGRQEDEHEM